MTIYIFNRGIKIMYFISSITLDCINFLMKTLHLLYFYNNIFNNTMLCYYY